MAAYTPMMEQYLKIKEEYRHCIVFYRLGDFYEMFFEDALIASKELDLTLTGRDCGMAERAPMCGVPHHSAQGYMAKLVEKGYKVAICEQTEDPSQAKTIVKREVVRVVTAGTVVDDNALDITRNNYIACVCADKAGFGIAAADVTTGEFTVTADATENGVIDELARINPAEVIVNRAFDGILRITEVLKLKPHEYERWMFDYGNAHKRLCGHFKVLNLSGFGLEGNAPEVCAAGALLSYLYETQKNSLSHIAKVKPYGREQFMLLDVNSRRNLELTQTMREKKKSGTLLWALDSTKTAMGARMLRKWVEQPLLSPREINQRLDAVEEFKADPLFREEMREILNTIYDIERIMGKVVYGSANGRDLIALKNSFINIPYVINLLNGSKSRMNTYFREELDPLEDLRGLIEDHIIDEPPFSIREGGLIKDGVNEELDKYRGAKKNGAAWLMEAEQREREGSGIKNLKVKYNKIFGYHYEVTNSYAALVPEHFIRRQTLANCERYTTEELKEIESAILGADGHIAEIEYSIFIGIRDKIAGEVSRILESAHKLAAIDALQSLGDVADKNGYVKPVVDDGGTIEIEGGRHPVIERLVGGGFVPNDTSMDLDGGRLAIITGPNMAGKSTYMRQVALIVLMAQAGSFVPAKHAKIGAVDRIFTRVGASDDLATGQSTFMVEMTEVANILNNSTKNSLIILDEIGRGTSTFDGLSIAWAVLEYIADIQKIGAKTLFATHYHELTELEGKVSGVVNYNVTVREQGDDIIFLRKIAKGSADHSYGIQVAKLAGVPNEIIRRSREILTALDDADIAKGGGDAVHYGSSRREVFPDSHKIIINELESLDVDRLTPIEALVKLQTMKELFRKIV